MTISSTSGSTGFERLRRDAFFLEDAFFRELLRFFEGLRAGASLVLRAFLWAFLRAKWVRWWRVVWCDGA